MWVMARLARVVVPGMPHHLTQRGNRREAVFFDEADRRLYLLLWREACRKFGLEVWAWCLMTNHVHVVVVPPAADALGQAMRRLNSRYTSAVNRRAGLCGHLWQGRFYSTPLDGPHAVAAMRYVERNPVRAALVANAWEYPWSSAAGHCGLRRDPLVSGEGRLAAQVGDWRHFLQDEDDASVALLRQRTRTGRPCGSPDFVADLQQRLGRALLPGKRGPKPRKGRRSPN